LITGIFTVVFIASIVVPNFPIEHHFIWMNTTFWIPCYLMVTIVIGFGFNSLYDRLPNRTWIRVDALLIIVISPLFAHLPHNNQSDYYYARDYARNQLDTMAENAIFFGSGDYTIFPLTYLLIVEGRRPDVTLGNLYGYIDPKLYADMPDELRATFPEKPAESDEPRIIEWILANTDRTVYTTTPLTHSNRKQVQRGLLYEYAVQPTTPSDDDIWATYTWHESLDHTKTHGDWTAELINYEYRVKRAQYAFKAGEEEEAVRLLKEAASLVHHDKRALHTIALTYARADRLDDAIGAFEAALHDDPAYTRALYNLANALLRQERYAEAKPYAVILLDQSPVSPRFKRLNEKILQGLATLQDEN
jgi:tetratricopeptide (TPR) repeat protein